MNDEELYCQFPGLRVKHDMDFEKYLNDLMNVHLIVRTIDVDITQPEYILEDLLDYDFLIYGNANKKDYKDTEYAKLIKKEDGQIWIRLDMHEDSPDQDILATSKYGREILECSQF